MNNNFSLKNKLNIFFENQYLSVIGMTVSMFGLFYFLKESWDQFFLWSGMMIIFAIHRLTITNMYKKNKFKNLVLLERVYAIFVGATSSYVGYLLLSHFPSNPLNNFNMYVPHRTNSWCS